MYPRLNFLLFELSAYSFFTILALIIVVAGSYWFARKRGFKKKDSILMLVGMGLSAFIGARLLNVIVNFDSYQDHLFKTFSLDFEGFSLYGGALFAVLAGLLIAHYRKINLFKFADTVVPFVGIGIALMRVGCYLNGCCFGKETNLPWGVKFPFLSPAHVQQLSENIISSTVVHAVHPTQIYEMIAAIICSIIAFILIKKKKPAGNAFLVFVILFSAFRWFNMYLRVLPYSDTTINFWYPLLYFSIIILCGYLLIKKK